MGLEAAFEAQLPPERSWALLSAPGRWALLGSPGLTWAFSWAASWVLAWTLPKARMCDNVANFLSKSMLPLEFCDRIDAHACILERSVIICSPMGVVMHAILRTCLVKSVQ